MISSAIPANFPIPFADSAGVGYVRTIPQASQIGITPGAASLTDGFPPLNFLPVSAGGVPPFGQDMNGILKEITTCVQWAQAGMMPIYNSAFSTAIGGYPKGSLLQRADRTGFWVSTVENNATDPDAGGAGWVDFMTFVQGHFTLFKINVTNGFSQACSPGVFTKIAFDSPEFDTLSEYNASTGVFTPQKAGIYMFRAGVRGSSPNLTSIANLTISNSRGFHIYDAATNTAIEKLYRGNPVTNGIAAVGISPPIVLTAGQGVYLSYMSDVGDTVVQDPTYFNGTNFAGWRIR